MSDDARSLNETGTQRSETPTGVGRDAYAGVVKGADRSAGGVATSQRACIHISHSRTHIIESFCVLRRTKTSNELRVASSHAASTDTVQSTRVYFVIGRLAERVLCTHRHVGIRDRIVCILCAI